MRPLTTWARFRALWILTVVAVAAYGVGRSGFEPLSTAQEQAAGKKKSVASRRRTKK